MQPAPSSPSSDTAKIDPRDMPPGFQSSMRLVAYALRSLASKIRATCDDEYRVSNLGDELTTAVRGEYRHGMHPIVWLSALAARWDVSLAGERREQGDGHAEGFPLALWLPVGRCRWDEAMACVRRADLARIVEDYAPLVATFAVTGLGRDATTDERFAESMLLDVGEPDEVPSPWVPALPKSLLTPSLLYAVWTATGPLAHGADTKDGNVNRFRTEKRHDLLTGRSAEIPLCAANAWRGQFRDVLVADMLERLTLSPNELPQAIAHALFAGGAIEAGSETIATMVGLRRHWRAMVPAVDLLGGIFDAQTMQGRLVVRDALPVCRETAADVAGVIAPGVSPSDLAPRLPCAADLFEIRQSVRNAHREIDGDGGQMILRTEVIRAGVQWVHAVGLRGGESPVAALTASCLAHGLALMAARGGVGASQARGMGAIAFDPYAPMGAGVQPLPSADAYLAHLSGPLADEIRETLMGLRKGPGPLPVRDELDALPPPGKGKRGRKGAAPTSSEASPETSPEASP